VYNGLASFYYQTSTILMAMNLCSALCVLYVDNILTFFLVKLNCQNIVPCISSTIFVFIGISSTMLKSLEGDQEHQLHLYVPGLFMLPVC